MRETGDAAYYACAAGALRRALHLAPGDPGALTERASLELSRHDFRASLRDALAARRAAPEVAKPYGVLVDSLVELGRYGAAGRALQEMVDRRPDLDGVRARLLLPRAARRPARRGAAMRLAVSAGGEAPENAAYVQALLGDLELARGALGAAALAYRQALAVLPHYCAAEVGLATVEAARGDLAGAIRRLRGARRAPAAARSTSVALGDTELAAGRPAAARRDLALVGAEGRLLARRRRQHRRRPRALRGRPRLAARAACCSARRAWARRRACARPTRSAGR